MPDWFTHTLVGWATGTISKTEVGLVVIGSLIPDLVKINLAFTWLEIDHHYFFDPLGTPVGAIIVGGIAALLIGAGEDVNMLTPIFLSMLIFPIIAYLPLRKSQQKAAEQQFYPLLTREKSNTSS